MAVFELRTLICFRGGTERAKQEIEYHDMESKLGKFITHDLIIFLHGLGGLCFAPVEVVVFAVSAFFSASTIAGV